jgi:hypothetical protein
MEQVSGLLDEALETELGGVKIYEKALDSAVEEDLRKERAQVDGALEADLRGSEGALLDARKPSLRSGESGQGSCSQRTPDHGNAGCHGKA